MKTVEQAYWQGVAIQRAAALVRREAENEKLETELSNYRTLIPYLDSKVGEYEREIERLLDHLQAIASAEEWQDVIEDKPWLDL